MTSDSSDSVAAMAPLWTADRSYSRVILRDVELDVKLGLHPWERDFDRPQRIIVNLELFSATDRYDDSSIAGVVDYDRIYKQLLTWPDRPHVDLIETLIEELVALSFDDPKVDACRISILKPDIFTRAKAVGVETYRVRGGG